MFPNPFANELSENAIWLKGLEGLKISTAGPRLYLAFCFQKDGRVCRFQWLVSRVKLTSGWRWPQHVPKRLQAVRLVLNSSCLWKQQWQDFCDCPALPRLCLPMAAFMGIRLVESPEVLTSQGYRVL